jgi:hypothetical protein
MNDLIVILQAEQAYSNALLSACLDNILISPQRLIIMVLWTKRLAFCFIDEQISVHERLFS